MTELMQPRRTSRRAAISTSKRPAGGIPVDSAGGPTVDPTENVKALNAASDERQNDLRDAWQDYALLLDRRQDDIRDALESHVKERFEMARSYEKEIREKEGARIDAINLSNTNAVQAAAEVQRAQATLLANQVATTGETLRAQVASVASAQEQRLATILEPITKTLESLRQAQYEQQGQKSASSDPILQAIRDLQLSQQQTVDARLAAGTNRQQSNWATSAAMVAIGLLISIGLFAIAIIEVTRPVAIAP